MAQSPNVVLHVIELAYGDRPFDVTDPALYPNDIQLRTRHELFHKENLLNLAVQKFPAGWRYGAIIDADFAFTRHDWALETIHQLQMYEWVQLFSSYLNVSGETDLGQGHRPTGKPTDGFVYRYIQNDYALPDGYDGGWNEPESGSLPLGGVGAPGGAWAFRRHAFDRVGGLLDRCILGSGDWYMAFGLAGKTIDPVLEERFGKMSTRYHPEYLRYIRAWQERARTEIRGNIGYVDGFALHHFHGSIRNRGYGTRDAILVDNDFSPLADVYPDHQGVLQLTRDKPRLRDAIRGYFLSRGEDRPHEVPKS
jgi:hypothetical protein